MRLVRTLSLLLLAGLLTPVAAADTPPMPRPDGVDYGNPKAHLATDGSIGAGQRTLGVARQLLANGKTPHRTLAQIVRWVRRNLRVEATPSPQWRTADQVLMAGRASGAADQAYMIGVFARAAGIPTVWLKALPLDWLRAFRLRPEAPVAEVGRVFLEVHIGGRWQLLDPQTARLYESYDVGARSLPDGMQVFDKGSDPYALVLPNRAALWRAQLLAHAGRLALPSSPWAKSRDLLARWRVHVTGQGGAATYAREAARTLGYLVEPSFNSNYAEKLAEARGRTLVVTVGPGGVNLPSEYHALLPPGSRELLAGTRRAEKGWIAHELPDGTRVILVLVREYGPVELAVSEALEG